MDKLNFLMSNFRDFLNKSYENIETIFEVLNWDNYSDFPDEWSSENFNLMVLKHLEKVENSIIMQYGCTSYKYSYCIKDKNKKYYRIVCKLKNDNNSYFFVSFGGYKDSNPYWIAPFDYVYLETKNREIIYRPYKDIESFSLTEI